MGTLQMLIAVVSVPKWLTLLRVIRWSVAIKEAALVEQPDEQQEDECSGTGGQDDDPQGHHFGLLQGFRLRLVEDLVRFDDRILRSSDEGQQDDIGHRQCGHIEWHIRGQLLHRFGHHACPNGHEGGVAILGAQIGDHTPDGLAPGRLAG